jgi:hypothetical protein
MKHFTKIYLLFQLFLAFSLSGQQTPSPDEKIPFVCTFSKESDKAWGDDDYVQTFFFVVPEVYKKPIYIRVFDADVGGSNDENHGSFDSKTRFTIYGGAKAHSHPDARAQDPVNDFKSGLLLASKTFSNEKSYDNQWYTFGPFNPIEGEWQPDYGGRIFKIVIEGTDGDDGNLYRIFLSSAPEENKEVEGGNTFTYEYAFRLADTKGSVSHLYPFVGRGVTAVKVKIFDFDNDGIIRVVSIAKKGEISKPNSNAAWIENTHKISREEVNTSLDIQFIKQKDLKNNNIVVVIANQYGELMPFYTTPIGGVPKFQYKIGLKAEDD